MPAAAQMRSEPGAEESAVKATDRTAAAPATRKAPAKKATARKRATPATAKPPAPEPVATHPRGRRRLALLCMRLVAVLAACGAAVFLLLSEEDQSKQIRAAGPAVVSADELGSQAAAGDTPVYWAGAIPSRKLELTTTDAGTFLRYLPPSAPAGDARSALTVATYPLGDAYATAIRRAKGRGMTSGKSRNGGIAVWSRQRPTSVYLAFPGVPQLVEIYAPTATDARRLALSGRIRPIR